MKGERAEGEGDGRWEKEGGYQSWNEKRGRMWKTFCVTSVCVRVCAPCVHVCMRTEESEEEEEGEEEEERDAHVPAA